MDKTRNTCRKKFRSQGQEIQRYRVIHRINLTSATFSMDNNAVPV
jgi:hypothetical protein